MDDATFAERTEPYRRVLRAHCYRMVGSLEEAEDLVQETFLRAWRARDGFEGRAQISTWLHRIATNVCLDALAQRPRRVLPPDVVPAVVANDTPRPTPPLAPELPWMQPFPDRLLDPETLVSSRETIEIAFLAALQQLDPRPRAVLLLCDVLGASAKEVASMLDTTVASVTSTLQRARAALPVRAPRSPTADERVALGRYIDAWEHTTPEALLVMLRDDARWAMPPAALWFDGRQSIERLLTLYPMNFHGDFRMVPIGANGQPAAAAYLRPHGATEFRLSGVHVLRVEAGQLAEITTFAASLCRGFELPMSLPPPPV